MKFDISIKDKASKSVAWHVAKTVHSMTHPTIDWVEIRDFFIWLLCWLILPVVVIPVAIYRKRECKRVLAQYFSKAKEAQNG